MFNELNRTKSINWNVDTTNWAYKKCSEMVLDTPLKAQGFFISKDRGYGKGAVAIMNNFLLNLPERYVEVVEHILETPAMVESIKAGKCALVISTYVSKDKKRTGYNVDFIDFE